MQKEQLQSLSDLVFGLAISVGSISLILNGTATLSQRLILVEIAWFSVGFVILLSIWFSYTNAMAVIDIESPGEINLNIILMLLISIEPFLLNAVAFDQVDKDFTTMAYALNIGLIMLILGIFNHLVLVQKSASGNFHAIIAQRHRRDISLVDSAIFLLSALPFFYQVGLPFDLNLRYALWGSAIVPAVIVRVHNILAHEE